MGKQGVVLEHHADLALDRPLDAVLLAAAAGGDVKLVLDVDLAGVDRVQPHDASEQGALAAAAGSDDDEPVVAAHFKIETLEDLDGAVGEAFVQAVDPDEVLVRHQAAPRHGGRLGRCRDSCTLRESATACPGKDRRSPFPRPPVSVTLAAGDHLVHVVLAELRHVAFGDRFLQEDVQGLDLLERHRLAEAVGHALLGERRLRQDGGGPVLVDRGEQHVGVGVVDRDVGALG